MPALPNDALTAMLKALPEAARVSAENMRTAPILRDCADLLAAERDRADKTQKALDEVHASWLAAGTESAHWMKRTEEEARGRVAAQAERETLCNELAIAKGQAITAQADVLRLREALTRKVPPHGRYLRMFMRHLDWCEFMRAPRYGDERGPGEDGMAPCTCNFVELVDELDAALTATDTGQNAQERDRHE
jgi:hypothetical protein